MATAPEKDEDDQPTRVEQVTVVTGQLIHARGTHVLVLSLIGATLTLVPQPWAGVSVALFVYLAVELMASKVVRR
jgi:hypothetical protein